MKTYLMKINGENFEARIIEFTADHAKVEVNGVEFAVEFSTESSQTETKAVQTEKPVQSMPQVNTSVSSGSAATAPSQSGVKTVVTPLPGLILETKVQVGDRVEEDQILFVLEAMKMESDVFSTHSGTVTKILVNKGDNVIDGQVLLEIGD